MAASNLQHCVSGDTDRGRGRRSMEWWWLVVEEEEEVGDLIWWYLVVEEEEEVRDLDMKFGYFLSIKLEMVSY